MLAGSYVERSREFTRNMPRSQWFTAIFEAHLPALLYSVQIKTGEVKAFHNGKDWFNHVQFSPTDPSLLMFCHEGPWHLLDRIWTIRTDGTDLRKIHARTMDMEIVGHEFWDPDGKIIWYDQQLPKGKTFYIGGTEISSGRKLMYKLDRDEWSVHFNVSRDGKLFAGDGGGPQMVAKAKDGQWIYLFHLKDRIVQSERLVNMNKHDYKLEPNVTFTPDSKWIVFRSNMHGPTYVYAVEVEKSK
jgi:oligogalacturonide lyase